MYKYQTKVRHKTKTTIYIYKLTDFLDYFNSIIMILQKLLFSYSARKALLVKSIIDNTDLKYFIFIDI